MPLVRLCLSESSGVAPSETSARVAHTPRAEQPRGHTGRAMLHVSPPYPGWQTQVCVSKSQEPWPLQLSRPEQRGSATSHAAPANPVWQEQTPRKHVPCPLQCPEQSALGGASRPADREGGRTAGAPRLRPVAATAEEGGAGLLPVTFRWTKAFGCLCASASGASSSSGSEGGGGDNGGGRGSSMGFTRSHAAPPNPGSQMHWPSGPHRPRPEQCRGH